VEDLASWLASLIEDRPGNFAMRIVEALADPEVRFPVGVTVAVGKLVYTVVIQPDRFGRQTVARSAVRGDGVLANTGPAVDWPGVPGRWSKLEAFRNAKELDRAFRGCDTAFDSEIP
jgi:hypothetical protein